jgi:Inovirus Gp2
LSYCQREQVFANNSNFGNIGYENLDVTGTKDGCWRIGEYSYIFSRLRSFLRIVFAPLVGLCEISGVRADEGGGASSERLTRNRSELHLFYEICTLAPWCALDVRIFRDSYEQFAGISLVARGSFDIELHDGIVALPVFNDFISHMRQEAIRLDLRKAVRNIEYATTVLAKEDIRVYLRTMPNATTKLLTVRAELQCHVKAPCPKQVLRRKATTSETSRVSNVSKAESVPETASRLDVGFAMEDRRRFFSNQFGKDRELFEHLIGHVWKMERDKEGIIHHHVLFVFDGQRVRDDFTALDRIRRRWERVTDGAGYLHSSHFKKWQLKKKGIWHFGFIRCKETDKVEAMIEDVAKYFSKDTQPLLIKPSSRSKALTMGLPWAPRLRGPGRPRIVC